MVEKLRERGKGEERGLIREQREDREDKETKS